MILGNLVNRCERECIDLGMGSYDRHRWISIVADHTPLSVSHDLLSITTGTLLRAGRLDQTALEVTSRMNDGGVIFADCIEQDFLPFDWGRQVSLAPPSDFSPYRRVNPV